MARSLKPQKVDEVKDDRTGAVVDVMLNRNDLTFFAELPGEAGKVEGATALEVKAETFQRLRAMANLTWRPAIMVSGIAKRDAWNRELGLKVETKRGYVAEVSPGGRVLWLDWQHGDSTDDQKLKWSSTLSFWRESVPLELPLNEGREVIEMKGTSAERRRYETGQDRTLLPYTEETWIALENIKALLARARDEIIRLITTDDGHEQMRLHGAAALGLLLPATTGAGDPAE